MSRHNDVVDVSRQLRALMAAYDSALYTLNASFAEVDPELETLAQQLRPAVDNTSMLVYGFLSHLEKTPAYTEARTTQLEKGGQP